MACGEDIGLNTFLGPVMQIPQLQGLNAVLAWMIFFKLVSKTSEMLAALTVSAAVWSYELWFQSETSHLPSPPELRFWSDGLGYLSSVDSPCLHVLRPLSLSCIFGSVWSISFSPADNSSVWMSLSSKSAQRWHPTFSLEQFPDFSATFIGISAAACVCGCVWRWNSVVSVTDIWIPAVWSSSHLSFQAFLWFSAAHWVQMFPATISAFSLSPLLLCLFPSPLLI